MTLLWPLSLLALAVVAAAAVWALLRPARREVIAASISLWTEALKSLQSRRRRSTRRISAAWLCLLAGAVMGVVALARPATRGSRVVRRVAVAVYPSADMDVEDLQARAADLLNRFDDGDLFIILLPDAAGGSSDWMNRSAAMARLAEVDALPILPTSLGRLLPPRDVQHTYHFATGCGPNPEGVRDSLLTIRQDLPPVTIDAVAAEPRGNGTASLFVAFRNHTESARNITVRLRSIPDGSGAPSTDEIRKMALAPNSRTKIATTVPAKDAIGVTIVGSDPLQEGFLTRRKAAVRNVAIIGRDWPAAQRFIGVDPLSRLAPDAASADIVIAYGADAPADKAALIVAPKKPPPGWQNAEALKVLTLDRAAWDGDDPIAKRVDFGRVAVRSVQPWRAGGLPAGKAVLAVDDQALIVRTDFEDEDVTPRRVWLALDPADENTNFCATEAFVVFMANTIRWLRPLHQDMAPFDYQQPLQLADLTADWQRLPETPDGGFGSLPMPGLYRDADGHRHAVSLPGLARAPSVATEPNVAMLPFPAPEAAAEPTEYSWLLAAAAMALWLCGWTLRSAPKD